MEAETNNHKGQSSLPALSSDHGARQGYAWPHFKSLGGYSILEQLGAGGMGAVFKARQPVLDRVVALKVITPRVAQDAAYIARFQYEARAAARLNHPNIVAVYSAGEDQGVHFLVEEFVEGETLHDRLKRKGRLDPREAVAVCIFVAEGLKHAWEDARIIHRDIKPDNIFISNKGAVKLGDLGLAKSVGPEAGAGLTQSGAAVGTPYYCSPEQAQAAKDLDFRADIYSLGCTLYHMLSGKKPYEEGPGQSPMSILIKQATAPPPVISQVLPTCPQPVEMLLAKMLAKQPGARHQSYEELIADLHRVHATLGQPKAGAPISSSHHAATSAKKKLAPALIYGGMTAAGVVVVAAMLLWAPWKQRGASSATPESRGRSLAEAPKHEPPLPRPADTKESVAIGSAKPSVAPAIALPAAGGAFAPLAAANPARPADIGRIRLAVLDLVTGSGLDVEDGKTLADFMRNAIVNSGRFEVLERQNIKKVLEEQNFSQAFADTGQSLVHAGKLLDANRVLGGRLARFSTIWTLTLTSVDVNTGKVIGSQAVTHDGEMKGLLESAQKAALDLVSKDPVAAAEERRARIAQWQKQFAELKAALAALDGDERKELGHMEGSLADILANLRAELETIRALVSDLQKKLEGLKQQHEPFQKQLDDLNAARAAIGNRHTPLVAKAQAEAKSARDTAAKYYTDYLVVAAKYVNDAIQLRHLAIAPVPADGKFANRPAGVSTTTEFSGEIFENMDETVDIGRAQSLARVGELLPSKHGYVSVVTALTTKPYGGGNQVQAKVFLRFPSQLEDTRARLGFVKMYWDFSKNLRAHEAAAYNAQTQLAAVENEFRSALSQWDSQNGDKLASLQNQVSPLAMQISELNSKLSTIRAERTAKEAVLNKPPSEQASALRQEISTRFAEKRRPLTEELEALEAKLKAEAAP